MKEDGGVFMGGGGVVVKVRGMVGKVRACG